MANDMQRILTAMPFIVTHGIKVTSSEAGHVVLEMDYDPRYSTPPDLFPASVLATLGDVAAVASCFSVLPPTHAAATLDFTLKMLAPARGEKIIARGRVLNSGKTNSVGAADVFAVQNGQELSVATLLATTRNFEVRR